jgi:hypothetical protein
MALWAIKIALLRSEEMTLARGSEPNGTKKNTWYLRVEPTVVST